MSLSKLWITKSFGRVVLILASSYLVISCANIASPSGGAYDLDPPKPVRSTPGFNARNVTKGKVEIFFDELVQIKKPTEKVIITPPQIKPPVIQAISNRVIVDLKDSLRPNTTYTIDFTDGISDYNEDNALENFSISFSTGEQLDSMIISGKVLAADNLEPVTGIYVGLHANLADSAFTNEPFLRISRTNDRGNFSIKGVANGEYHIYALNDKNGDYKYDNPTEALAFYNDKIVPSMEDAMRTDTVFNTDKTVDSVKQIQYTRFLPDNLLLRSFESDFKRQYLQKHERTAADKITLLFGSKTQMPKFTPLNFIPPAIGWALTEKRATNDSIVYWITDPTIAEMDTLTFEISYLKTDSLNQAQETTDTLNFTNRSRKNVKEDKKKDEKNKEIVFVQIKSNLAQPLDIFAKPWIEFEEPINDFKEDKIKLSVLADSTYKEQKTVVSRDSLNPRKYYIENPLQAGSEYKIQIDSSAVHSYSGKWNNKLENKFKVRNRDEYGNLALIITGLHDGEYAFVELLDQSDKPFAKSEVKNNEALFADLNPGKYYARIILDTNNNGIWDTGDYATLRQPEVVLYCNKLFEIKANWDLEENWDIYALPLDKQKPLEITKNKPEEKETKRQQLEKRDNKSKSNQQQSSSTGSTSTSSTSTRIIQQ